MKFRGRALTFVIAVAIGVDGLSATLSTPTNQFVFQSIPGASFQFGEIVGKRVAANIDQWLLRAPQANPGMLEMFRVRDRKPAPQIVPWAGEFAGKYLISAVQALRMSEDPRLRQQIADVVAEFVATQSEDGYLGPFPKQDRLLRNWDLWGHYHAIQALLLWHEETGDTNSLTVARRAGDLVCNTFLDTGRRVFDAGDHEMNMSVLTAMGMLYRITAEPRYLRMAREVEKDWERAGDYLRAGLDGREFFQSPRPRWESLHDLQGLLELWRASGEDQYRRAFVHHWRSIRRWDRRNTGGFSSGEQATGNPYAPTVIETCCTVAWMVLTVDYLKLTGDLRAADDLELATLNGGLGAQHPTGRWWTYNTPMDGVREASAHSIVFQARAGTPELNCCSVNGPRVLGLLSDWAVMARENELVINWLGAGRCSGRLSDGTQVSVTSTADVWRGGRTSLRIASNSMRPLGVRLRIPTWARGAKVSVNGDAIGDVEPGRYLTIRRRWSEETRIDIDFPLLIRFTAGANEASGKISLYRGPLLLAYDQRENAFDEDALSAIDLGKINEAKVSVARDSTEVEQGPSWIRVDVPAGNDGQVIRLIDFASAGSRGTRYRSWLPASPPPPAPAFTQFPRDDERLPIGEVRFQWRADPSARAISYRLEFSTNETFAGHFMAVTNVTTRRVTLNAAALLPLAGNSERRLWWRVVSSGKSGETLADVPAASFTVDPLAPPKASATEPNVGPDGELILHSLRAESRPKYGRLLSEKFSACTETGTELNGRDERLTYAIPEWPPENYSVKVRVRIHALPQGRIAQVFSAWTAGSDDPLRLVIDGGKLFARIEAGAAYSTPGIAVETGHWHTIAAVKNGARLILYLDGNAVGDCAVPEFPNTRSESCALGGNPRFSGNEFLAASFADLALYARALSASEIKRLAERPEH